jgi:pilus assembly protein FimV
MSQFGQFASKTDFGVKRGKIMIRRLRLLGATLFALYCSTAFGLGMGELELKSALNQRFDGEIVLTKVGALEIDEILPNLASQADFDRVGVDRNYQLTDLRFSVRVREDGEYVVGVTSSKPVIEPFLNFIVEVIWPTGRILREYTVLLDPPVFGSDGIEKIAPGTTGMGGDSQRQTSGSTGRMTIPPSPSGRSGGGRSDDGEYGMTGEGDTLWTIAMNVRPSDNVSVQQTMLALQRANPEAFINDNINLLKAGYVLRVPDMDEIRAAGREEAIAEVMVQNEEFSDYKASAGSVTQLDARRTSSRQTADSDEGEDGELKLLASDRTGARSGADDARSEELENSLAVAREDLDRARRANTELNVRMDDLADQVETLTQLVQLKDDQLAALRAEVQKAQAAGGQPAPTTPPVTTQQPSQSLLSNPMVLGGLALVLIAGVVGLLIVMRKRKQSSDIEEDDFSEMLMAAPEEDAEVEEEAGEEAEVADEDEDVTQQTSDVIY